MFRALFYPSGIWAQTAVPVELEKILVVEDGVTVQHESADTVKVINPSQNESDNQTISDILSDSEGIHLRRFGGLGDATSVSIRGSSFNQVSFFLDGVPLTSSSGVGSTFQQMSSSYVDHLEIYKRLGSASLGSNAIGGVVHIVTKKARPGFFHRHRLGFGSFTTLNYQSEVSYGGDQHEFFGSFSYDYTKGDFSFLDNRGTPLNPNDDQIVKRQNNDRQVIQPYLKWTYHLDDLTSVSISERIAIVSRGIPGLGTFQSSRAKLDEFESITSVKIKKKEFFVRTMDFETLAYFRLIKSQFEDPLGEIGLGAAQDNENITRVFGIRSNLSWTVAEWLDLVPSIEYQNEWFLPKDYTATPSVGSRSARQQINVSTAPILHFFENQLRIRGELQSLNAFYSVNNNDPSLNSPGTFFSNRAENQWATGLLLAYEPIDGLVFSASGGRQIRLPQFHEMFGDRGSVLGNPQLTSEKVLKYDFGIRFQQSFESILNRFVVSTQFFQSFTDDLIQFEIVGGFARASNIGQSKTTGVETSFETQFFEILDLNLNYTYQHPVDQSTGRFLIGRPKHEVNGKIGVDYKGIAASFKMNFIDDQFLDSLNTQKVNSRLILNGYLGYTFKKKYRVGFEARNLTNSQVVDAIGFPLPGRSFFAHLDVSFFKTE